MNGIFGSFFWTNGTALFRTKETERIEPYHLMGSFGCQGAGSGYASTRNTAAELPVKLDVLVDDLENNIFGEEDDDFIVLSSAASTFARKNLNRILG